MRFTGVFRRWCALGRSAPRLYGPVAGMSSACDFRAKNRFEPVEAFSMQIQTSHTDDEDN
jgi:hypothetical protein